MGYVGDREDADRLARTVEGLGRRACLVQVDQADADAIEPAVNAAAELCRAYHQSVSSHPFMEASAHVLAAGPNALILEHMDWRRPLFTEPLRVGKAAWCFPRIRGLASACSAILGCFCADGYLLLSSSPSLVMG